MPQVGDLAWARSSRGRLTHRERLGLGRDATLEFLRNLPRILIYRFGLQRNFAEAVDLTALSAPDSATARQALEALEDLAPPYMVNHSIRTYWFSRILGEIERYDFDDEALYVSSLLHDIGFFGQHSVGETPCFAVRGADAALALTKAAGWDAQRSEACAETICLHVNGAVPLNAGTEAYLMQRGVLVDVAGLYAWDLNPEDIETLFVKYPRLDQASSLWPLFRDEAKRQRDCRGYFALKWLGFGALVRFSPWR